MEVFVARQPIFDKNLNIVAYELLYRIGENNYFEQYNQDQATSEVIANSFLLIGIESLTGGKKAFINFTQNLLKNETAYILPKDMLAIEILENVEITKEVVLACEKLKKDGYLLVLDDFVFDDTYEPLIKFADIIKIDFLNTTAEFKKDIVNKIGLKKVKFLAEKVETREEYEEALELGYSYFQGYFFSEPVILSGQDIPGYKLNYLQVLAEINGPELDFDRLEKIITRDVSLTYKLLKYINSAAFGLKVKISSIKHALIMLGLNEIRKWVSLLMFRGMGTDKPEAIMISSVVRAKFCEFLAPLVGLQDQSSELFLMGMLSHLDVLTDLPMAEVIDELPISEAVKYALLGNMNSYRKVFNLAVSYERADWVDFSQNADEFKLDESKIPDLYLQSIAWANDFLNL